MCLWDTALGRKQCCKECSQRRALCKELDLYPTGSSQGSRGLEGELEEQRSVSSQSEDKHNTTHYRRETVMEGSISSVQPPLGVSG